MTRRRRTVLVENSVESYNDLVRLITQNALRMGARTTVFLCPPRLRQRLQENLRMRNAALEQQPIDLSISNSNALELMIPKETLEDYIVAEIDFLNDTLSFDSDDDASSGDEDELLNLNTLFCEETVDLDNDASDVITESLYTPFVPEHGQGLPFNRRKLEYFDCISSQEIITARTYLKQQLQIITRNKTARILQKPIQPLKLFTPNMTPPMAAALLLESLQLHPHESIAGIAQCYHGIVAAGVALLDGPDVTQPNKPRASRSEIMAALAPLLITNLEQSSGDILLDLAKLRRHCGTRRYQRRFVQRVACFLVRPPHASVWCLQHQNDMQHILAATELILDGAFELFAPGWYERGRWMLADSKRAETLHTAAQQLKNLSHETSAAFLKSHKHRRVVVEEKSEKLNDWEVVAVDREIRCSVSSVLNLDWTVRTGIPKPARPMRSVSSTSNRRRGSPKNSPRASHTTNMKHTAEEPFPRPLSPPPPSMDSPKPPPRSPKLSPKRVVNAPMSPSASSVGTSTSTSDLVAYRPATTSTPTPPTHQQYRLLTSSAAERKRTVAACRALRAQIQRFEEAFIKIHGRPPKGAQERAPLATTYAQYREWKRAIRADAACRIQALLRGASCRLRLLSSNDPELARVVLRKAGRPGPRNNVLEQISLPGDIGNPSLEPSLSESPSHAQQWSGPVARPRPSTEPDFGVGIPQSPSNEGFSFADLQARKRELKQQLKQYDINFVAKHGRMPVKAEKEPIRHLYESYNRLKSQISQLEREGRQSLSSSSIPQRAVSPVSASESSDDGSSNNRQSLPSARNNRRIQLPMSPQPSTNNNADLAALKAEKQSLHSMLRQYEKDFFREHRRQVSSFTDIRPVANQYRRYKEIKKAITALQSRDSS